MTAAAPARTPTARTHPAGLAILALACGGFGIGTTEFAMMGLLQQVAGGLKMTIPDAGYLISAYALGVVVGAPLITTFAAKVPRKALLIGLMIAFTIGNLWAAVAPDPSTMIVARFVAGLPHGAYFGICAVVAASLVPPTRRASAVARVMLGLSIANVIGVPLVTVAGQQLGWRWAFVVVGAIGVLTIILLMLWVPRISVHAEASIRTELGALKRLQVWLALLVGTLGFGGFFAVYSYIGPTMTQVAGLRETALPLILALYGLGMVAGSLVGGRLADWSVIKAMCVMLPTLFVVFVLFSFAVHNVYTAALMVFVLGGSGSALIPALQTRLMDVSANAQSLAAALNHSALNVANALGAWLGGLVIAAGFGYTAPALVGAGLAVLGLIVVIVSAVNDRRTVPKVGALNAPEPSQV